MKVVPDIHHDRPAGSRRLRKSEAQPEHCNQHAPALSNRPRTLLVLGGGEPSSEWCHLGVLEVFERSGIPIGLISASGSAMSIAAAYAANPDIASVYSCFTGRSLLPKEPQEPETETDEPGLGARVLGAVRRMLKSKRNLDCLPILKDDNEKTVIPLRLLTLDPKSGAEVILSDGEACRLLYRTPHLQEQPLMVLPLHPAQHDAREHDVIVAVDVSAVRIPGELYPQELQTAVHLQRACADRLNRRLMREADFALRPVVLVPDDAERAAEALIAAGRHAARSILPNLRRRMLEPEEHQMAELVLRHAFTDEATLDECIRMVLAVPGTTLLAVLIRRHILSDPAVRAMQEVIKRKMPTTGGHL